MTTMFRKSIIRIGRAPSVFIATTLATVSSVLFTYAVMMFKGIEVNEIALTLSILAPLTIAPFLFWPLFSALVKIHHLEMEMRKLAMIDELTGVMSRRAFLDHAERSISLARRSQIELALVYIDLDNFKTINDVYGHAVGDEVLKCFAAVASGVVRKSDVVGRLGGEEFAMIIYGSGKEGVRQLIEKLLVEIRNASVTTSGEYARQIHFTASVGVAYLDLKDSKGVDQLIAQADKALYEAKHAGKDRMAVFEEA